MLTPTDIHHLLGFLTLMSSPDDVEIVLGDLVYDAAAEEERDVDITVTYRDSDGLISVFKGIEVKKHGRPLDVTHVEQLAAKLRDMPSVNHRAIVSASGYTKAAIKKAAKHGVDLYALSDWTNTMEGFKHVKFAPWFSFQQRLLTWASPPHIDFIFDPEISEETTLQIGRDTAITDRSGSNYPQCRNLQALSRNILDNAMASIRDNESVEMQPGVPISARVKIDSAEEVFVHIGDKSIQIPSAVVTGEVVRIDGDLPVSFKALIKVGETTLHAGCVIAELSEGTLIAIGVGQADHSVKLFPVPLSERNKEKIRKLRLK